MKISFDKTIKMRATVTLISEHKADSKNINFKNIPRILGGNASVVSKITIFETISKIKIFGTPDAHFIRLCSIVAIAAA